MHRRNSFKFCVARCLEDPRGDLHIQLEWRSSQGKNIMGPYSGKLKHTPGELWCDLAAEMGLSISHLVGLQGPQVGSWVLSFWQAIQVSYPKTIRLFLMISPSQDHHAEKRSGTARGNTFRGDWRLGESNLVRPFH